MNDNLKKDVQEVIKKNLSDEELLKLNELENVEGGSCALGCLKGCLLSGLSTIEEEPKD